MSRRTRQVRKHKSLLQFLLGNCRFVAMLCTLGIVVSALRRREDGETGDKAIAAQVISRSQALKKPEEDF